VMDHQLDPGLRTFTPGARIAPGIPIPTSTRYRGVEVSEQPVHNQRLGVGSLVSVVTRITESLSSLSTVWGKRGLPAQGTMDESGSGQVVRHPPVTSRSLAGRQGDALSVPRLGLGIASTRTGERSQIGQINPRRARDYPRKVAAHQPIAPPEEAWAQAARPTKGTTHSKHVDRDYATGGVPRQPVGMPSELRTARRGHGASTTEAPPRRRPQTAGLPPAAATAQLLPTTGHSRQGAVAVAVDAPVRRRPQSTAGLPPAATAAQLLPATTSAPISTRHSHLPPRRIAGTRGAGALPPASALDARPGDGVLWAGDRSSTRKAAGSKAAGPEGAARATQMHTYHDPGRMARGQPAGVQRIALPHQPSHVPRGVYGLADDQGGALAGGPGISDHQPIRTSRGQAAHLGGMSGMRNPEGGSMGPLPAGSLPVAAPTSQRGREDAHLARALGGDLLNWGTPRQPPAQDDSTHHPDRGRQEAGWMPIYGGERMTPRGLTVDAPVEGPSTNPGFT
jgi:hypothetical protein